MFSAIDFSAQLRKFYPSYFFVPNILVVQYYMVDVFMIKFQVNECLGFHVSKNICSSITKNHFIFRNRGRRREHTPLLAAGESTQF